MERKKTVYIAGPITGVPRYWEAFEEAEEQLTRLGYTVLTPSRLPEGMSNAQYMRICFAMIDSADAVVFLPGWQKSEGAKLERGYCHYIGKPRVYKPNPREFSELVPPGTVREWFEKDLKDLEEVLNG